MAKYTKSDKCIFCGEEIYNRSKDGLFMCMTCSFKFEQELKKLLLEKSQYADKIKKVSVESKTPFGLSHKTTCIKVEMMIGSNTYVQIPTSRILEIRELNDTDLLFKYIEMEIKVQYALSWNKYIAPSLQHLENISQNLTTQN